MNETTKKQLCPIRWLFFITFFGGPLASGYFLFRNFQTLGFKKAAISSLIFSVVLSLMLILIVLGVFDSLFDFKPYMFQIIICYTLLIQGVARSFQGSEVKKGIESGIKKYPFWKILVVVILSFAIFCIVSALVSILIGKPL